jgi:methylated-DNA-protein-cysteine methyltransferase-like protein
VTRFYRAVYQLVTRIPRGQVATYGQIAALLGWPRAARAVGYAMRHCPSGIPWHRVVNASGGISLRANVSGMLTQRVLLEQEGVRVRNGHIRLDRYRWRGPRRTAKIDLTALAKL